VCKAIDGKMETFVSHSIR